jgi:hypothetical protein
MSRRRRIGVLGTFANVPYAGMAWMHCQFLVGLARLGHDVFYAETTTAWPYHPIDFTTTDDPSYALAYLARVMDGFGLGDRWAYLAAYADGRWYGPLGSQAIDLLRSADAVLNITGSTTPEEIGVPCRLVYVGTDPVLQELRIANGDETLRQRVAAHAAHFTYGENIGSADCPVPPLPFPTHPTRQPVVLNLWDTGPPPRSTFTTVTNWEVKGYDFEHQGEVYNWSKHHEYLKIIDLPRHTDAPLELAMGLSGVSEDVRRLLRDNGWAVVDAFQMSLDPWPYRDYVRGSAAEFSVAKDMVARTRSGWFSERSACYLAAGRPVITQDTGFGRSLPTGEGLFAFRGRDDALAAIDSVRSDYPRHSRAARAIAENYFKAETVLARMLDMVGL